MDNSLKKQAAAVMAASVMIFSAAISVCAVSTAPPATTRPRPGSNGSTTTTTTTTTTRTTTSGTSAVADDEDSETQSSAALDTDDNDTQGDSEEGTDEQQTKKTSKTKATTAPLDEAPVTVVETAAPQTAENTKKGVSKGAMFIWFLLSVIVNGIISFVIANRFYKLSRKESHVTSEIRALRRDVEEKFVNNVGGFAESEVDVENSNEDYSMDEEGIKMTPPAYSSKQKTAEADDMFRKWEEDRAKRRAALKRTVETEPELDDEYDEDDVKVYKKTKKKRYQPKRRTEPAYDEDDDDEIEEIEEKGAGFQTIKGKTKEFLGDIFPFKED